MDVFLAWTLRVVRSSQVALMKGSDFMWLECTYHTVQYTSIVEEDQILFVPKARHEYKTIKNLGKLTSRVDKPAGYQVMR